MRGSGLLIGVVGAVQAERGLIEVRRERLRLLLPQVADDHVGQQGVGADRVDVVERATEAVVVEPARLDALAEQELEVDVLEPLVHPPQGHAAREDVEHHHREAFSIRRVRERVPRQVLVQHGEDAEAVQAGPDDGEVPDGQTANFEVVDGHAHRSPGR